MTDIEQRLDELRKTPRCGDDLSNYIDTTPGLIDMVREVQPKKVLELGSDRGISTEVFLLLCEEVVAVDPWEDFPEISFAFDHIQDDNKEDFMNMRRTRGAQFLERCGQYKNLKVIRDYSPHAQEAMKPQYLGYFDLVYIDAVHEYQPVIDDARASWELIRPGGWFAGHDYVPEAGGANQVCPAVDALFGKENIVRVFSDSSWIARRPDSFDQLGPRES
jgi:predicted O-methyltransferase YrrM